MSKAADPNSAVNEILRFNKGRIAERMPLKYGAMAQNVFAFFRGTDHLFASRWPQFCPSELGPNILQCGDLHLENFGAYETDDGEFRYDINDFDEAVVAPCSLDLVRLTASILLAGEVWHLTVSQATGIALDFLCSYRTAVVAAAESGCLGEVAPGKGDGPVWDLLGKTTVGDRAKMLDHVTERNEHDRRRIVRNAEKHPEVSDKKVKRVRKAVAKLAEKTATPAAYQVLDVTGRIMGIGSLGLRRYTVLVAGGGTPDTNQLLDIKEEIASSVLACAKSVQPDYGANEALRVVRTQCQLQSKPAAGLAVLKIGKRRYRVRAMIPDENRSKLDQLQRKPEKLRSATAIVGQLVGWSHLRGCDSRTAGATRSLAKWIDRRAIDAVLASAIRCVDITCRDYASFCQAYAAGQLADPLA